MIIRIPMRFEGSKEEETLYSLFDSVATYSCIGEDDIENLGELIRLHKPARLATASEATFIIYTQHQVRLLS